MEPSKDAFYSLLSFYKCYQIPSFSWFLSAFLGHPVHYSFPGRRIGQSISKTIGHIRCPCFILLYISSSSISLWWSFFWFKGNHLTDLIFGSNFGRPKGISGLRLPFIYMICSRTCHLLYPLCRWFGNYKAKASRKKMAPLYLSPLSHRSSVRTRYVDWDER